MIELRTVYVLSCVLLLGDGLSQGALANDPSPGAEKPDPCESRKEATLNAKQMIQGEVLRVEGNTYVVKGKDGKEVSLQTDQTTEKIDIRQGDKILAYVNEQNHAIWIGPPKSTDRRNEHEYDDCKP